jgi:sugar/nucleoside kinase (ribokinase family)
VKRLGVVGTMVWDTIYGRGVGSEPMEEWGGIAYALAAIEVGLPDDWELVPLIKVGHDLAARANAFLATLTRRSAAARFIEVPEPNNRVTIRYSDAVRRAELLRGGVPPWTWTELGPLVHDLDAVYVNFISGFEMPLETARALRRGFDGPLYADVHSLLLGVHCEGLRVPHRVPDIEEWFACFDAIQLNEDELALVGTDPVSVAARAMARGVGLVVVTLGERGAIYVADPAFRFVAPPRRGPVTPGAIRTARLPAPVVDVLDPTGCGDVFGGSLVAHLLQDIPIESAVRAAIAAATRNVGYRGATSLHYHLRQEIVPT